MDFLSFSLGASRVGVIRVEVLRLVGIEGLSAVSFPPAISSYLLVVKGEFLSCPVGYSVFETIRSLSFSFSG
jgi:ABC-type amino acid transport system permease subunit